MKNYLFFLLLFPLCLSAQKERISYLSVQSGLVTLDVQDDFVNQKHYQGTHFAPLLQLDFLQLGKQWWHQGRFNIYAFELASNTPSSIFSADVTDFSGGELSYRLWRNLYQHKAFSLGVGTGVLATGSDRQYEARILSLGTQRQVAQDITAASLLLGLAARYELGASFFYAAFDIPVWAYYQRPIPENSIRSNGGSLITEWFTGDYSGYNFQLAFHTPLYKNLFINFGYYRNYYRIQRQDPMDLRKQLYTLGIAYNF